MKKLPIQFIQKINRKIVSKPVDLSISHDVEDNTFDTI